MRRPHGGYSSLRSDAVEEESEDLVEGLRTKTSALKSAADLISTCKVVSKLTIDIGNEIRDQNKLISDMDNEFDRTGGFLSSTVGRVGRLLKAGHNRYLLYLLLFSLFVFFVIYAIIKFR